MFVDNETKLNLYLCLSPYLNTDCVSHIIEQLGKIYKIPNKYMKKKEVYVRYYWKHYNRYGKTITSVFEEEFENYLKPMCKRFIEGKNIHYSDDCKLHAFGVIVIYSDKRYKYKTIMKVPDEYKETTKRYLKYCGITRPLCCPLPLPCPS